MTCACGTQAPEGARWCGRCGARLEPPEQEPTVGDPTVGAPTLGDRTVGDRIVGGPDVQDTGTGGEAVSPHRTPDLASGQGAGDQPRVRVALLVVLVALLSLAALLVPRSPPPPEALLGRLDDATGRSSTATPPSGPLEQRWSVPLEPPRPGPGEAASAAGPDHVLVSGVLLEAGGAGDERTWPDVLAGATDPVTGRWAVVEGDLLTLGDVTGVVQDRSGLRDGPADWQPVGPAVGWVEGDPLLVAPDGRVGRVTPGGSVRWVAAGTWTEPRRRGAWLLAAAPVDEGPVDDRWVVVDPDTGREVLHVTGTRPVLAADVVVQAVDDELVATDVRSGREAWRRQLPPRTGGGSGIIGLFAAPGDAELVGTPLGAVLLLDVPGAPLRAQLLDPVDGRIAAEVALPGRLRSASGRLRVGVDEQGVVAVDERVTARGWDGSERWSIQPGPTRDAALQLLEGTGDVVLSAATDRGTGVPDARSRVVLDAADGSIGARLGPVLAAPDGTLLAAEVGGIVALRGTDLPTVAGVAWIDPLDGTSARERALRLVARAGGDGDQVVLAGTRRGTQQTAELVLSPRPGGATTRRTLGERRVRLRITDAGPQLDVEGGADPTWTGPALPVGPSGRAVVGPVPGVDGGETLVEIGTAVLRGRASLDGTIAWVARLPAAVAIAPVLAGDVLVTALLDGSVVATDVASGEQRWRTRLPVVASAGTAAGEQVLLGLRDGTVVRLAADGTVTDRLTGSGGPAGPVGQVAVVGEHVLATLPGRLLGFGAPGG